MTFYLNIFVLQYFIVYFTSKSGHIGWTLVWSLLPVFRSMQYHRYISVCYALRRIKLSYQLIRRLLRVGQHMSNAQMLEQLA
jgi:hypothetical protein